MRPRTISLKQLCQLWPDVPRKTWREWRKVAAEAWTEQERYRALERAGDILGHEVQSIFNQSLSDPCGLYYVNLGDTYRTTLRLHDSGTIDAGCWGDWLESMERRGVHFD